MKVWRLIISAALVALLAIASLPVIKINHPTSSSSEADLLVTNGTIYTSDASMPFVECMAIRNTRILRLGNCSSIKVLAGKRTKVINLEGKVVVPGFIDSHVHLIYGGLQMIRVELRGVNKTEDFVSKVKQATKRYNPLIGFEVVTSSREGPSKYHWARCHWFCLRNFLDLRDGSWLLGHGWNNDLWGGELPVASWIDDITPRNPVWLTRMDGHMGLANSEALKLAGVTKLTEDLDGGAIMKNNVGEPTGLLVDSAMKHVQSCIPEVSVEERKEALLRASQYALSKGVTTVVDVGRYCPGAAAELPWEDFSDVYRSVGLSGEMKIRVCLFFPLESWEHLHKYIVKAGRNLSQWIYLGGVKAFADGSLGSSSALLHEPYVDEPHNYGLQVADMDDLFNMTLSADRYDLQVAIHAIGDRANDLVLDMYASVALINGRRDRRFRIEHAQHLAPATTTRFGQQAVIASVQPDHLLYDGDSARRKLGEDRAENGSYLFKSLLIADAPLAFGSDWPVVEINPLGSIQTAIKRVPNGWEKSWISSECITLDEALKAYTISAAYACFLDKDIGSLSQGKLADFVVLSTDSWEKFSSGGSTSVQATYVGGIQAFP